MSTTLIVHHIVPISDEPWGGPLIIFNQWLPNGEKEGLLRVEQDLTARLWLDLKCVSSLHEIDEGYIANWMNVKVNKVYIDVIVANVPDGLATFIFDERDAPKPMHHGMQPDEDGYAPLRNDYDALGFRVFDLTLTTVNRFIDYARNEKGQYWLEPLKIADRRNIGSWNNRNRAMVKSDAFDWVRWCPSPTLPHYLSSELGPNEAYIKCEDWSAAQKFVASEKRSDLVLELLANSERLFTDDRRRSAVIEAASALEVALLRFAKSAKLEELAPSEIYSRYDAPHLHQQIEHLGFSGSFRYLLPILFTEEVLSTELLHQCQQLIELRNSVVHAGQRDVGASKARPLIRAARKTCETLLRYTEP